MRARRARSCAWKRARTISSPNRSIQAVLRARIETQLRLRSMRSQLQQQNDELEAWRQNLERDLAAARLTQQSLIPQKPPDLPGWDIAACYEPVIQVGGDIYGWLRTVDGRTLFWIADATGHGASAALLTTLGKTPLSPRRVEHNEPAEIMEAVNNDFRSIFGARSFMTAMCVALDPATGRVSVVGAGHPPSSSPETVGEPRRFPHPRHHSGCSITPSFLKRTLTLEPGDAFFLYTDGLYGSGRGRKSPDFIRASWRNVASDGSQRAGVANRSPGTGDAMRTGEWPPTTWPRWRYAAQTDLRKIFSIR